MTGKKAGPLRGAVDELIDIEAAMAAQEQIFAEQKADHTAKMKSYARVRSEVMAELRGEGRQTRLRFNRVTGEVIVPDGGEND